MNLSTLIDVLIGMSMMFAVLALCSSTLVELWAGVADRRAKNLSIQLGNMLGEVWRAKLMTHPLMAGMREAKTAPSYIAPALFRQTLLDLLGQELDAAAPLATVQDWMATLDQAIAQGKAKSPKDEATQALLTTVRSLLIHRQGDVGVVNTAIDDWFNHCMQRASAWYKRNSQWGLFLASGVVVCALNADALQNLNALAVNPALRTAVVSQAEQMLLDRATHATAPKPAAAVSGLPNTGDRVVRDDWLATNDLLAKTQATLSGYGFAVGWAQQRWASCSGAVGTACEPTVGDWVLKLFGLLVSMLAASLGADFWFAMISRLMPMRSVGKSPDDKP